LSSPHGGSKTTTEATEGPARAEKTAALLQKLKQGVANIVTGDDWKRLLAVQARFHRYSFRNIIAICLQRENATNVAGFHLEGARSHGEEGREGHRHLGALQRPREGSRRRNQDRRRVVARRPSRRHWD